MKQICLLEMLLTYNRLFSKFSAEDKNIKLDESWERITVFFNEFKKPDFQIEIKNSKLNEKLNF